MYDYYFTAIDLKDSHLCVRGSHYILTVQISAFVVYCEVKVKAVNISTIQSVV